MFCDRAGPRSTTWPLQQCVDLRWITHNTERLVALARADCPRNLDLVISYKISSTMNSLFNRPSFPKVSRANALRGGTQTHCRNNGFVLLCRNVTDTRTRQICFPLWKQTRPFHRHQSKHSQDAKAYTGTLASSDLANLGLIPLSPDFFTS